MFKKMSNCSITVKIIGISLLLLVMVAGGSYLVFADTAGPGVTDLSPQPGSTVESLKPLFSLRFNDIDKLDPAVTLTIDGQSITPTIAWDGLYETYYDSCTGDAYTVRVGDDYTKGVVSARLPQLATGQHTIYYKLKDGPGNITENTYNFTVSDTQGPRAAECTPADGAIVATGFPVIKAKLSDPNGIDAGSISVSFNGSQASAAFDSLTGTVTYKPAAVLLNGAYQVQLSAKDTVGNASTTTWNFTVSDTNPPAITNLVPANNGIVYSTTPTIGADISDLSGIANPVKLNLDGSSYDVQYNAQTGKIAFVPPAALTEDSHTVSVAVYDAQGNQASASWAFSIDRTGPALSEWSVQAGSTIEALRPTISFRFNDPAKLDANSVILQVDGTGVTPIFTWDGLYQTYQDSCTGQPYTVRVGDDYTKGVVSAQTAKLNAGTHTFYYKVKDQLGNVTEGSFDFTCSDTTGPVLVSCSPAQGGTVNSGCPSITAVLDDANNIVPGSVYMKLNGAQLGAAFNFTTRTVTYNITEPLLNGSYQVELTAADELGNPSSISWTFTVNDVTPPVISSFTPANNSVTYSTTPTIEASVCDPSGIKSPVYLQLDSDMFEIPYNTATGKASYTPAAPLNPGTHTVTMAAYDYQGQKATATWAFYIDRLGPEITIEYPTPGSTIDKVSPKISTRFYEPSQLDATKLKMLLDGVPVNPAVVYDGLYQTQYDSCTGESYLVRVGDDYTNGAITFQTGILENLKEHTVEMYVYDKVGNVSHPKWSFTVHDNLPPEITSFAPTPGTITENSLPAISAKITDNNRVDARTVAMTLNGDPVTGSFAEATGIVSYKPAVPLGDGEFTVVVAAYDICGNRKSAGWKFTIQHTGSPDITNLLPPPGSGTRALRPTISAKVSDVRGIDLSKLALTVDGTPLVVNYKPDTAGSTVSGTVYGTPGSDLSSAMHSAVVTVFDLSGNRHQKTWQFGVNQFGDMGAPEGGNCTYCHNEGIAAIEQEHVAGAGDCGLCHTLTPVGWEPDCCYCHGHDASFPPPIGAYECTTCHNANLSYAIPTHGSASELNMHDYAEFPQDCKTCHSQYLTREHNVYVEGSGLAYDCNTCHKSIRPDVQQAISGHNRACSACHGTAGAGHQQAHNGTLAADCLVCHKANISDEHLANSKTQDKRLYCGTCHDSADPAVQLAISTNNLSCDGCHAGVGDHEAVHTSGIDTACQGCHGATLTSDHITARTQLGLDCDTCHQSQRPEVAAAVQLRQKDCNFCHASAHNTNLLKKIPEKIPLHPAYFWSEPFNSSIFAAEDWLNGYIPGGNVLISNRRNDSLADIWNWYKTEMAARGWTLMSPEPEAAAVSFKATFQQGDSQATVYYYSTERKNGGPVVSAGARLEIIYRE